MTTTTPSAQAVRKHLKHLEDKGLSPYTVGRRAQALDRLAKMLPVPLLEATPDHLDEWRASLRGRKNSTIACYISHVRSFYDWCVKDVRPPLLAENPASGVATPKVPVKLPHPIPEADLMLALSYAGEQLRPWIVLAGWCGLRCQEIAWLRVENLRLRDTPPVVIVSAEAAKGITERTVDLAPWVVKELHAARLPASGYAFTKADGQPFSPHAVSLIANAHLKGCGIPSKFHNLRDRFLTQVYAAGQDILITQQLAGHSSPTMTARYAAYSRTGAAAAVAALPTPTQESAA